MIQAQRHSRRIAVDIPITVSTVLETAEGAITDLTERGARIHGVALPQGTRLRIDYRGQAVFAQCRWAEVDRMGVQFLFPLADGPLHERLLMAQAAQPIDDMPAGLPFGQTRPEPRLFGRAMASGTFGRRG